MDVTVVTDKYQLQLCLPHVSVADKLDMNILFSVGTNTSRHKKTTRQDDSSGKKQQKMTVKIEHV